MKSIKEIIGNLRVAMTDARQNESHFESWMILNEAICNAIDALAEQPAPVAQVRSTEKPHKQQKPATGPDCWVCVKDGKIIGFYDRPFTLAGIEAVRYVHHEEVESLAIENIRLQNWAKDLNDWNDSLKERLSYREAYPANFTRDWVGLTDEEIWKHWWNRPEVPAGGDDSMEAEFVAAVRAIEAKLKEKNGF